MKTNFLIFEIKNESQPERQAITELLQYSNGLQVQDFPGLENDKIGLIIIAKNWDNILIQSVINGILFKGLNILPIKIDHDGYNKESVKLSLVDLYNFTFIKNFESNIINKSLYKTRTICFTEHGIDGEQGIDVGYYDQKIISLLISKELEKRGYNGFVFFSEFNDHLMYGNCVFIMTFDWLSHDIKNWHEFLPKKSQILFNLNINYEFDTSVIRDIIKRYYLNNKIYFEEGNDGDTFDDLSKRGYLFSYGASFGFLNILHNDLVKYMEEDIDYRIEVTDGDDLSSNEIFSWQSIDSIFNYKGKKNEELNYFNNFK